MDLQKISNIHFADSAESRDFATHILRNNPKRRGKVPQVNAALYNDFEEPLANVKRLGDFRPERRNLRVSTFDFGPPTLLPPMWGHSKIGERSGGDGCRDDRVIKV
jgi:hypothetical protein